MICAICKKQEANVSLKHFVEGVNKELNVCQACAEKHGLGRQLPLPVLTDFLFGVSVQAESPDSEGQNVCPTCHLHSRDLQKTSLLGCADCYDTFSDDVQSLLDSLQPSKQHLGKVPESARRSHADYLESTLQTVAAQGNFERAAVIRDRIREIRRDLSQVKAES
ncbi:MAG: UvrB/UvrC motif-containing protein [Verrucomicrobia bacterium]|nr:UvrB/UvrC motif-containing protein [Verrucomicrobiota bacterium]